MLAECNENCQHRQSGKCKLKGSLKFTLDGIDAGGLWNLSTSGGISLSNIASEIVKYKKAGISIVDVPFELSLTEQQSLAYGTYYSIDLHRTNIKPKLTNNTPRLVDNTVQEVRQLNDAEKKNKSSDTKKQDEKKSSENNSGVARLCANRYNRNLYSFTQPRSSGGNDESSVSTI